MVESYRDFEPPPNFRQTIENLVKCVPAQYLVGLKTILLTNRAGPTSNLRKRKVWSRTSMPKIYLVNVGANRSHENKARSPIFPDGTWIYVPFPHKSSHHNHPFPEATLPYIRVANGIGCHADPAWDGLT
jgi:hypothetical protein